MEVHADDSHLLVTVKLGPRDNLLAHVLLSLEKWSQRPHPVQESFWVNWDIAIFLLYVPKMINILVGTGRSW